MRHDPPRFKLFRSETGAHLAAPGLANEWGCEVVVVFEPGISDDSDGLIDLDDFIVKPEDDSRPDEIVIGSYTPNDS